MKTIVKRGPAELLKNRIGLLAYKPVIGEERLVFRTREGKLFSMNGHELTKEAFKRGAAFEGLTSNAAITSIYLYSER